MHTVYIHSAYVRSFHTLLFASKRLAELLTHYFACSLTNGVLRWSSRPLPRQRRKAHTCPALVRTWAAYLGRLTGYSGHRRTGSTSLWRIPLCSTRNEIPYGSLNRLGAARLGAFREHLLTCSRTLILPSPPFFFAGSLQIRNCGFPLLAGTSTSRACECSQIQS